MMTTTPKTPRKRSKPKKSTTVFAKNQVELADRLGVNRKTIQRWRKMDGCPMPASDGRYRVAEWEAWQKQIGDDVPETQGDLKAEQIRIQNEILAEKLAIIRAENVKVSLVEQWASEMVMTASRKLDEIAKSICHIVIGCKTPAEAQKVIQQEIDNAKQGLYAEPWKTHRPDTENTEDEVD